MTRIVLSKKSDGSMDDKKNKDAFLRRNDISLLVLSENVHGNKVKVVNSSHAGKTIKSVDGLITKEKDLFIGVPVADCIPVFLWTNKAVGIFHAGWKGLISGVLRSGALKMREIHDSEMNAYIGPGIGKCHFEVKEDVASKFPLLTEKNKGKMFVDLKKAAKEALIKEGLNKIKVNADCTYCMSDSYFSYRRDGKIKSMFAIIGNR